MATGKMGSFVHESCDHQGDHAHVITNACKRPAQQTISLKVWASKIKSPSVLNPEASHIESTAFRQRIFNMAGRKCPIHLPPPLFPPPPSNTAATDMMWRCIGKRKCIDRPLCRPRHPLIGKRQHETAKRANRDYKYLNIYKLY